MAVKEMPGVDSRRRVFLRVFSRGRFRIVIGETVPKFSMPEISILVGLGHGTSLAQ
jgi:hypothetical protein